MKKDFVLMEIKKEENICLARVKQKSTGNLYWWEVYHNVRRRRFNDFGFYFGVHNLKEAKIKFDEMVEIEKLKRD